MTELESQPSPSARLRSREEVADYLIEVGSTLGSYGCPSYRLEDVIREVAKDEGYEAFPFALPTGLFVRVRSPDGGDVLRMARVFERGVDLERLTVIDEIFNEVAAKKTSIEKARGRIRDLLARPPLYSNVMVWAATTVASGASAVFFRGSAVDVLVAAIVGAVIGGSRNVLARHQEQRLLHEFLGGLFAAIVAWLATFVWPSVSPGIVVLAGAISLFPGMTFTTGVAEVAQKNLVSGGARLMEAAVTLLLLIFGVALTAGFNQIAGTVLPEAPERAGLGLPWQALALVLSSLSFAIIFYVPRRWLWAALASGATGYTVTAITIRSLPSHVAAFAAALAVCLLANGLARRTQRPAQLFQLTGMTLLMPGSVGFVGLGAFLRGNVDVGMEKGFNMAMVSAALVIGVLVANAVLPARKLL